MVTTVAPIHFDKCLAICSCVCQFSMKTLSMFLNVFNVGDVVRTGWESTCAILFFWKISFLLLSLIFDFEDLVWHLILKEIMLLINHLWSCQYFFVFLHCVRTVLFVKISQLFSFQPPMWQWHDVTVFKHPKLHVKWSASTSNQKHKFTQAQ